MKRALLIAGGTVGGLGAVLSITPPQLNSQGAMGGLTNVASAATTTTPVAQTSTPTATTSASTTPTATTPTATTPKATATKATTPTPKATKKKVVAKKRKVAVAKVTSTKAANTPAASTPVASTPTPTKSTAPAPTTTKVSGTFTGSVVNVNYGNVQVQITVVNGKITDAQAVQAPNGRSDRYTSYAVPILRSQTLAAQGSNIQGASGASYTSYGWYTSLQSALSKAGL